MVTPMRSMPRKPILRATMVRKMRRIVKSILEKKGRSKKERIIVLRAIWKTNTKQRNQENPSRIPK